MSPRLLDPRLYQIGALASLLALGAVTLHLDLQPLHAAGILAAALLAQYGCSRLWRLPRFDPASALITGLSLCLLLRTDDLALAMAVAVAAIASKFVLRWRGKHLFNPAAFGIVAALAMVSPSAWVSPGQWGSGVWLAFAVVCAGGLVVNRAARGDVTIAFLLAYGSILFARAVWLGDPLAIPLHRLQTGALLIFAFFMISDPKTTPDSRPGRVVYASLVAAGALFLDYNLYATNGLLWSLMICAMAVPLIDVALPGERFSWGGGGSGARGPVVAAAPDVLGFAERSSA